VRDPPRHSRVRRRSTGESHEEKTNGRGSAVGLISSSILLILAILASPALSQTAVRPAVKVGEAWQFIQYSLVPIEKPNLLRVITSATPVGIAGTSIGQPLTLTPDLNIIESPTRKFSDRRDLSFPLEIGKSWTYTNLVELKDRGGNSRMDAAVPVAAYEKVTVRAGQFDAFKIEAKGKWGQEGPPAQRPTEFTVPVFALGPRRRQAGVPGPPSA
jgi:hypothetical protein